MPSGLLIWKTLLEIMIIPHFVYKCSDEYEFSEVPI